MKPKRVKPKHILRDIPWWRRFFNIVSCPEFGGDKMQEISKNKAWACAACKCVLVHKKGEQKL